MLVLPFLASGQEERKFIREGYRAYNEGNYSEAEIAFRKAEEADSESYIARYNTSAALYQQQNLEESGERFTQLMGEASDPAEQAKLLHNMGNVMLEGQQFREAAEAYKRSLRLNPGDEDTREQNQEQQEQNQDQNDQQEQQDQDNQQQGEQEQQEQGEQEQQEQESQQQNEPQDQQEKQQMQELSREEAERLLQAILQKEKEVREKVDEQKAKAAKIKTEKDW